MTNAPSKLSKNSILGLGLDRGIRAMPSCEELNALKVALSLIDLAMFVNYIVTDVVRDN